jgi:dienelactone hydrolase
MRHGKSLDTRVRDSSDNGDPVDPCFFVGLTLMTSTIGSKGIEHAFTVFNDARGRYNERADTRSWHEMETFLEEAFGSLDAKTSPPDSTDVETVEYDDNGFPLTGYLSIPPEAEMGKTPAVVIVPDWDGVSGPDGYEAGRATLLAGLGYVGFAADIYGSNLTQVEDFAERANLTTLYRTDYELFVSRIQAAVDLVASHELVDPEKVFLIGCEYEYLSCYCERQ